MRKLKMKKPYKKKILKIVYDQLILTIEKMHFLFFYLLFSSNKQSLNQSNFILIFFRIPETLLHHIMEQRFGLFHVLESAQPHQEGTESIGTKLQPELLPPVE